MSEESDKQFVKSIQDFKCELPEELFDGWAVAKQVREATGKEFTAENISAVLDAVVVLARKRLNA